MSDLKLFKAVESLELIIIELESKINLKKEEIKPILLQVEEKQKEIENLEDERYQVYRELEIIQKIDSEKILSILNPEKIKKEETLEKNVSKRKKMIHWCAIAQNILRSQDKFLSLESLMDLIFKRFPNYLEVYKGNKSLYDNNMIANAKRGYRLSYYNDKIGLPE